MTLESVLTISLSFSFSFNTDMLYVLPNKCKLSNFKNSQFAGSEGEILIFEKLIGSIPSNPSM